MSSVTNYKTVHIIRVLFFESMIKCHWSFLFTAQKMKFSIKDFFGKWDQIRRKLQI